MTVEPALPISIVIPTYNRRDLVAACLRSLEHQTLARDRFEVIVVSDGCTDGTVEWLASHRAPFDLRWIARENGGLSAARNSGTAMTRGEVILCLDCDMVASEELVAAHLAAHARLPTGEWEKRLVQGGLDIHASVQRTAFIRQEERLLRRAMADCEDRGGSLTGEDIFGGNISVPRELLLAAGGFNEELRRLRNTDGELALRLEAAGARICYAPRAHADQTHVKDLDEALRAAELYGRAYVYGCEHYPGTRWRHSPLVRDRGSPLRNLVRRTCVLRQGSQWRLAGLERALSLAARLAGQVGGPRGAAPLFRLQLDLAFWRGVHAEGGGDLTPFVPRAVPILCYHNVSPTPVPAFRLYVLPPLRFAEQMRWLLRQGYTAITLDQLHAYLAGRGGLPARPIVITFDDAYRDLMEHATPLLDELGLPHTHFVNTGKIGRTTDWVERAPDLAILDADDIRAMAERYGGTCDFQAHGKDHLAFSSLDEAEVEREVGHCVEVLEPLTGRPVHYLAYPYGEYLLEETPRIMRTQPIACSFTVDTGACRPGQDLHLLPRVEVFAHDLRLDFVLKCRWGHSPIAATRARLKEVYKRGLRFLRRHLGRGKVASGG